MNVSENITLLWRRMDRMDQELQDLTLNCKNVWEIVRNEINREQTEDVKEKSCKTCERFDIPILKNGFGFCRSVGIPITAGSLCDCHRERK